MSRRAHYAGYLAPHDHACLFYASEQERDEALTAYAMRSFARRARLVYAGTPTSRAAFVAQLSSTGIDVERRREANQLRLLDVDDSHLAGGTFDAGPMLGRVRAEAGAATREGWTGLAVAGDLGWVRDYGCDEELLLDYERQIHEIFAEMSITALCLYDHESFGAQTRSQVAHIHPLVIRADPPPDGEDRPQCCVEPGDDGVVRLVGEVDISNADSVIRSLMAEALRQDTLIVDMSQLSYIDVPTLNQVWVLADELAARGGKLSMLRPHGGVMRALRALGFEGLICEEIA